MKIKKETNKRECASQSTNEPKRFSKTWEAVLMYKGTTIINDPSLLQ
jgi:hypothetical protein